MYLLNDCVYVCTVCALLKVCALCTVVPSVSVLTAILIYHEHMSVQIALQYCIVIRVNRVAAAPAAPRSAAQCTAHWRRE